jgi:hypothetical protein
LLHAERIRSFVAFTFTPSSSASKRREAIVGRASVHETVVLK